MENLNRNQKIILIIILLSMLIFIGYYIVKKTDNSEYVALDIEENIYENITNEIANNETAEEYIIVHVIGSVKTKGIVKLKQGARISDVIEAAGGITEDADLSKINLAYVVEDGQKIYVPNVNDSENTNNITEEAGENVLGDSSTVSKSGKVNINTASQTELETLSGIGPSTALKIINYRNENGNFEKIEDIKNVSGIGESKYENIKNSICVR